jgi:hypothetical protein
LLDLYFNKIQLFLYHNNKRAKMEKEKELNNEFNLPIVGKKRIALYNGFVGQSDRVEIKGQVVDIPVLENYLNENWDIFCMLPQSMINRFRAVQDINMGIVRNPRIQIDIIPYEDKSIDKLLDVKPIASVPNLTANTFGIFELPLKKIVPKLESGKYLIRTHLKGTDSIRQNFLDLAFLTTGMNPLFSQELPIGFGRLSILPNNYEDFVIISDIDKTFLNTRFEDRQGLLETLLERIENKQPIPGMDELYRKIKHYEYPLIFISASPSFFHRVLEGVFKRFQIPIDGLYLKKVTNPVSNISKKIFNVITNINEYLNQGINEMLNRSVKFLNATMQTMVDQTAYKLKVLLFLRKMQPTFAKEIFIGDNTESDFLIITLYQLLLTGAIEEEQIVSFLYNLRFKGKDAINRDLAYQIFQLVKDNYQIHGKVNPIYAAFIHRAYPIPDQNGIYELLEETLGKSIDELINLKIKLPVVYENMWELALNLYQKNVLNKNDLIELGRYYSKINPEYREKIEKDIPK